MTQDEDEDGTGSSSDSELESLAATTKPAHVSRAGNHRRQNLVKQTMKGRSKATSLDASSELSRALEDTTGSTPSWVNKLADPTSAFEALPDAVSSQLAMFLCLVWKIHYITFPGWHHCSGSRSLGDQLFVHCCISLRTFQALCSHEELSMQELKDTWRNSLSHLCSCMTLQEQIMSQQPACANQGQSADVCKSD